MSIIKYNNVEILRKEHVVLKNVSFEVNPGEFVYLIGKVGSGKSSLLKSLYAEVPVEVGEARVFDYDLLSIRRKQIPHLRRRIGIVFQDFQLLTDRSVYANLEFVLEATGWKNRDERAAVSRRRFSRWGWRTSRIKCPTSCRAASNSVS